MVILNKSLIAVLFLLVTPYAFGENVKVLTCEGKFKKELVPEASDDIPSSAQIILNYSKDEVPKTLQMHGGFLEGEELMVLSGDSMLLVAVGPIVPIQMLNGNTYNTAAVYLSRGTGQLSQAVAQYDQNEGFHSQLVTYSGSCSLVKKKF